MSKPTEQTALVLEDGMYENLPFEQYAAIDAINGSSIVHMRRSPMFYRHMKDNPPEPTPALKFGVATHRMILEPERVGDIAVWGSLNEHITDAGNLRSRNGKLWDAFKAANADKLIVTSDELEAMLGTVMAARKHVPIRKYADAKGSTELSLVWHYRDWHFKCRLDKWCPKLRTVFDLKTTCSCQAHKFGNQAYKLGYHIKMAIQCMGVRMVMGVEPHLKLGAIESKAPHESAVFRVTSDVILQGLEELDLLLNTLAACEESNTWPAELTEETDLILPTWATSTETNEDLALEGLEL